MMEQASFWVTNISQRNVSLGDLNLTIPASSSVNLLDSKHYHYTLEQLQKSATSGSIFNKRNKILLRKKAPEVIKSNILFDRNVTIPDRTRSIVVIKNEKYEELEILDGQFQEEIEEKDKKVVK